MGNISKDFAFDDMKKIGLHPYVFNCWVDYDSIYTQNLLDIHIFIFKFLIFILMLWMFINIQWKTQYKIMFRLIFKMLIGSLNTCTTNDFSELLAYNPGGHLKLLLLSLNNRPW